ncbi:MAG: hypothetical protein WEA56_09540 [Balneolaceae bacterium]
MISACSAGVGADEEEEIPPLEYSFYSGYWKVDLDPVSTSEKQKKSGAVSSMGVLEGQSKAKSNSYNLELYKLDEWSHYIMVSNAETGKSEIVFGDEIDISFAVVNTGSEIFSVYLNASTEAEITILWDGIEYDTYRISQLQSNYYESITIPIDNFYGELDLSPGSHEIELILDVPGQSEETKSRTIQIETPDIKADTFEFTETMYFIENEDQVVYGNLSYSDNTLYLHGYGTLEIMENNEDKLITKVVLDEMNKELATTGSDIIIELQKQTPNIRDTQMTNLLTYDLWVLVETSSTQSTEKQEWMFHRSGNYDFIHSTAGLSRKAWGYDSETSVKFGFTRTELHGKTEIKEITQTHMVMDDGSNTFIFERN